MWTAVALASVILMITMGIRQTVGLFVHPLVMHTGMSVAQVSMAFAIGQLMWGMFQPIWGAFADKGNSFVVLCLGAVLIALGQAGTVWAEGPWSLTLLLGILSPVGAAAGSFSMLIGIVASRLTADKRSMASGIINAGGSAGQFAFAPAVQFVMQLRDYSAALVFLGGCALLTIVPSWFLCRQKVVVPDAIVAPKSQAGSPESAPAQAPVQPAAPAMARPSLREQLAVAVRDRSYLLLHAGFFTCGFHVAFLTTHLPGEINLCGHSASVSAVSLSLIGLCNIAGSIVAGALGKHVRMKYILAGLYGSRALMILIYLMSPKTELTFYVFAAATGFTWLATVPPTAGIVGKLFGMRYLATLFGLTLLSHQIGAFLGAWFGGLAVEHYGSYLWVWYLDVALATLAALVNLPIREDAPATVAKPAMAS